MDPIVTCRLPLTEARLVAHAVDVVLALSAEDKMKILSSGRSRIGKSIRETEDRQELRESRAA